MTDLSRIEESLGYLKAQADASAVGQARTIKLLEDQNGRVRSLEISRGRIKGAVAVVAALLAAVGLPDLAAWILSLTN